MVRLQVDVDESVDPDRDRGPALGLYASLGFHVADGLCSYRLVLPTAGVNGAAERALIADEVRRRLELDELLQDERFLESIEQMRRGERAQ